MSYRKPAPKYQAVLKTPDGKILERGYVSIFPETQSIDFKGEFVPLFNMGDQVSITQIQDEVEVIRYIGEVYLSSQRMLRLVHVTEEILPGAHSAFLYRADLFGRLTAIVNEPEKKFHLFAKKATPHSTEFPVHLHAISLKGVKFTCEHKLASGQQLCLNVDEPALKDILLSVAQVIDLGQEKRGYKCEIKKIDDASLSNLDRYITYLSAQPSSTPDD